MNGSASPDVVVIGGGVIGCSIAYYLACEGARVTVLEKGDIGGEASCAAAGMLAPMAEASEGSPFRDLGIASLRMFEELAPRLREESGVDIEYLKSGILRVPLSDAEAESLRELARLDLPLELHWLERDELRTLEPAVSPAAVGALYSPEECQVNADRLVRAFALAAERRGAVLRRETRFTAAEIDRGHITGVRTTGGRFSAGHVVLAAGAWSGRLASAFGCSLPVFPVRGQMMALPASRSMPRYIIWGEECYLVPKANGLLFAGATTEKVGFRKKTTRKGLADIKRMSAALAPVLGSICPADAWAGFRPGSGDGLPILGPVPDREGLTVATGHYRNGVLLSPITGRLIARSILDGSSNEALAPFSPSRFL
ncbi:MAG: glycine oxidase ThiO [Dehalococcoidia bacterium]|nr:glycine oxidase ThiO [Dehalococcoidia bacterium]